MAVLDLLVAGAREIAARSLELQARQDVSTTSSTDAASSTIASLATPSTSVEAPTLSISGQPFPTPTGRGDDNDAFKGGRDSTTSPLLFFVALGFGVVFTNLWIIVGVKYCFRYNARNRQLRMAEEGDPVALENMPRPHRRRREKKLMTMEEVNEKFPMLKYKNWVAARAQEGLPTMGGISAPPSRANSIRSVEGVAPEPPSKERASDEQRPATSASARNKPDDPISTHDAIASKSTPSDAKDAKDARKDDQPASSDETGQASTAAATTPTTTGERPNLERVDSEDDNDDEHINAALPPECMGTSGDACAICIETLEDDDDVRGLTCGHAFHAVCLDPWLTSRRACCPLCKADYYTPKPRPPPADGAAAGTGAGGHGSATFDSMAQNNSRLNLPSAPQTAWMTLTGRGRWFVPSGLRSGHTPAPAQARQATRSRRRQRAAATPTSPAQQQQSPSTTAPAPATSEAAGSRSGGFLSGFRPSMPRIRVPQMPQLPNLRRNRQAGAEPAATTPVATGANTVTPSQLEAGTRPAVSASA